MKSPLSWQQLYLYSFVLWVLGVLMVKITRWGEKWLVKGDEPTWFTLSGAFFILGILEVIFLWVGGGYVFQRVKESGLGGLFQEPKEGEVLVKRVTQNMLYLGLLVFLLFFNPIVLGNWAVIFALFSLLIFIFLKRQKILGPDLNREFEVFCFGNKETKSSGATPKAKPTYVFWLIFLLALVFCIGFSVQMFLKLV